MAAAGSRDDGIARRVVLPVDMEAAFEDEAFLGLLGSCAGHELPGSMRISAVRSPVIGSTCSIFIAAPGPTASNTPSNPRRAAEGAMLPRRCWIAAQADAGGYAGDTGSVSGIRRRS